METFGVILLLLVLIREIGLRIPFETDNPHSDYGHRQ